MTSDIFLSGFLAGSIQTIIGHPLDTLKTNLLMNHLSFHHLYRGWRGALWSGCVSNGCIFATEDWMYARTGHHFMSGILCGIISGIAIGPFEYVKLKRQLRHESKRSFYKYRMGAHWIVLRECTGLGTYFYMYHSYREKMGVFLSGGMAGVAGWMVSYPFELCYIRCYTGSLVNIWKSFYIVVARAFLVNACLFSVYEPIIFWIKK